jgi:hypothetical protein
MINGDNENNVWKKIMKIITISHNVTGSSSVLIIQAMVAMNMYWAMAAKEEKRQWRINK